MALPLDEVSEEYDSECRKAPAVGVPWFDVLLLAKAKYSGVFDSSNGVKYFSPSTTVPEAGASPVTATRVRSTLLSLFLRLARLLESLRLLVLSDFLALGFERASPC